MLLYILYYTNEIFLLSDALCRVCSKLLISKKLMDTKKTKIINFSLGKNGQISDFPQKCLKLVHFGVSIFRNKNIVIKILNCNTYFISENCNKGKLEVKIVHIFQLPRIINAIHRTNATISL